MTNSTCPICGAAETTLFWAKQQRELNICRECRHVFWTSMPTPEVLTQYYETAYSTEPYDQAGVQQSLRDYYRGHIVELRNLIGKPMSEIAIADVGCSYPVFLETAMEAGVGVGIGVDWSPEARDYGAPRGIPVISPDEMLEQLPDESLDILRYSHTLEHLIDPLETVRQHCRKVRPGGLVYVTQPNIPVFRFGPASTDIHDSVWPTHLHFFSPLSLMRLASLAELEVEKFHSVTDPEFARDHYARELDLDEARRRLVDVAGKGEAVFGELNNFPNYLGLNSAFYARRPPSPVDENALDRLQNKLAQQGRIFDLTRTMLRMQRRAYTQSNLVRTTETGRQTMNYIKAASAGGPSVLRLATGASPSPKPDEVLIRVLAAGVNRPDVAQRKGVYPPPPGASPFLGLEVAGEIAELGAEVSGYSVGDRVCALANGGGYAEYCVAPATQCLPWPAGYDAVRAAALPETYFTVWANLFMIGRLAPGETVLIHGGSSGIGITAIQLAGEFGATALVTVGSAAKATACVELGAAHAINYREQDFAEEVSRLTDKRGVDVVLDMVGAPYTMRNIRSLAMDGRLVQIAFLEGSKLDGFDLGPIMTRRLTVTGSTMRPRSTAQKGAIAEELRARVWPVLDAGRCAPVIHATFPLVEAAAAHTLMESSSHIGKIVLEVAV